jgi:hypothetical protein
MSEISEKYQYMVKNLLELESTGWNLDKSKNGITVSYKFPAGCPTVSIRMESTIPVETTKLMALITETNLFSKYVPFCTKSLLIKQINRSMKVGWS